MGTRLSPPTPNFRLTPGLDPAVFGPWTLTGGVISADAGTTSVDPDANDGATLGVSGTAWSDLFLASGAVIDFNASNVTLTHSAGLLTLAGGLTITGLTTLVDITATTARTTTDMVTLNGDTLTTGNLLVGTNTISGSSLANRSAGNNLVDVSISRTDSRTSGTTADDFDVLSLLRTQVTTGSGGTLTAAGSVLKLENVRTQTNGTLTDTVNVLEIVQDTGSTGAALLVSGGFFNLDSTFDIDSGTGSNALDSTANTADVFTITASSLTDGDAFRVVSNASGTQTRNLVELINDNALATGTTVLRIQQDANIRALHIDSPANTNQNIFEISSANSLTGGSIAIFNSNSSTTNGRSLVQIINEHASANGTTCLSMRQDAAQRVLFLDQNADGLGLEFDLESTTAHGIDFTIPTTTTGNLINCDDANSLTTGGFFDFQNTISASSLTNRGAGSDLGIMLVSRTESRTSGTTADDFDILSLSRSQTTTGSGGTLTAAGSVLKLENATTVTDGTLTDSVNVLEIIQDSLSSGSAIQMDMTTQDAGFIDFVASIGADATSAISSFATSAAVTHHIQCEINGTTFWIPGSTTDPTA